MRYTKAKEVALLGVLFALAMALSFMESALTPLLGLLPAMNLGLSNVVVMFALLFLPRRQALLLAILKAVFALLTRGVTAGFLSLCGGGASFAVLCLLLAWPRPVTGFIFSVCGALAHNIGQLCGAAVLLSDHMALAYAPVLLCAGTVVGSLTWAVSRAVFPALRRVWKSEEKRERNIIF